MRKRKERNVLKILAPLLLFAVGAGIFLYPAVSNYLSEIRQTNTIENYQAVLNETDEARIDEEWEKAVQYNENLAGDPVHDPFIVGSGYIIPDNYDEVLNVDGDGVMGYVDIPEIGVYLPIYHGTDEEVLAKGAGHIEATALPIGSVGGHSVISAHRGLPSAELFTKLDVLEEGDVFYIHILNETLAYQVDKISVIEPSELASLRPEAGRDLVTLLTCTPYGVNTHRLLVRGTRIPYDEAAVQTPDTQIESTWLRKYLQAAAVALGTAVIIVIAVLLNRRKKKKRGGKGKDFSGRNSRGGAS